ncbi:MAG: hypothetical protein ACOC44_19645 [Promethearchaeia archaeon]
MAKKQIKKKYLPRNGAPFKKDDAQEIGEFIENCKDKSTEGILEEVKKHPDSKIYQYLEWNKDKAAEKFNLQQIRNIVNHIEVKIVQIGSSEPVELDVQVNAFQSVIPEESNPDLYSGEKVYVSQDEAMKKDFYRKQVIERAKTELRNWRARYKQYRELQNIIKKIDEELD